MDRRQLKTRAAIFDALTNLLAKKRYSSITVQDIIDEANIGRSTFYSHFETKDDMLKAMCDDIFAHIFSNEHEKCSIFSHGDHYDSDAGRLAHILYHIKDSRYRVCEIISCESGELFLSYFKTYMKGVFREMLPPSDCGVPQGYIVDFYASAFAETVRWWISSREKYTPEDVAAFFAETAHLPAGLNNH